MKESVKKYLIECNQYVYDLENNPELRMTEVTIGDQVFFLKPDEDSEATNDIGESLFNCGLATVISVETLDGKHRSVLPSSKVGKIHLKSDSYPFELSVDIKHIIKNYTAEEKK